MVVAKVEYMVVEMVEKVVVEMGYFGGKRGRRRWCGGVEVVGMVEEMEEKKVEELVVEMEGRVEKMAGQWEGKGRLMVLPSFSVVGGKKMKEKNERERKGSGVNI